MGAAIALVFLCFLVILIILIILFILLERLLSHLLLWWVPVPIGINHTRGDIPGEECRQDTHRAERAS